MLSLPSPSSDLKVPNNSTLVSLTNNDKIYSIMLFFFYLLNNLVDSTVSVFFGFYLLFLLA